MSNKKNTTKVTETIDDGNVTEQVVETVKAEILGKVSGCTKLNVRKKPSKESVVATVINRNEKVTIDSDRSNEEWYRVTTDSGVKGFCMKKFITLA